MSVGTKLLQAAAGGGSDPVYVDDVFSCFLYEGNATSRSIVNGIDLADKGGLVWTKNRDDQYDHNFVDSARGLTNSPYIRSNTNGSQGTDGNGITVFNNNGYTVGSSGSWNANGNSHVSWTFAKQEKFFDIVTYTGDGTTSHTINHNLGSVPGMILVKDLSRSTNWSVYHRGSPVNASGKKYNLKLNVDNAAGDSDFWPTTPTSTQFFLGDSDQGVNRSGDSYVAYLFGHNEAEYGQNSDEAIIYCGSFTTTSTWGNFKEEIGFEPQWLLVKRTDSSSDWMMLDMMRGVTGPGDATLVDASGFGAASDDQELKANSEAVESTQGRGGFYSKGYIGNVGGFGNATYVYMAIRRPNKPASEFAATGVFGIDTFGSTGDGDEPAFRSAFPCDTGIRLDTDAASTELTSRLTQGKWMYTDQTSAEGTANFAQFDYQNGWGASTSTASNYYGYMFRRAKGFFDVVAYSGNATSGRTVNHNLGVAPELLIVKRRNSSRSWYVYSANQGNNKYTSLEDGVQFYSSSIPWNDTTPTASVFSVGSNDLNNGSGDNYITYLFATVDGISKVGNYTGTGSDLNVDCGFSAGARFVLIHRTDADGGWYVYDSVRGIVAGNDPYKLLNSNAAQVTNTDYIDPLSAGFTVTSSAPAGLNASSGNYIFLAIA